MGLTAFGRGAGIGALHGEKRLTDNDVDLDTSSYDYVTAVFVGKAVTRASIYPIGTDGEPLPVPLPVESTNVPGAVLLQAVTTGLKGVRIHTEDEFDYIDVFAGVTGIDF